VHKDFQQQLASVSGILPDWLKRFVVGHSGNNDPKFVLLIDNKSDDSVMHPIVSVKLPGINLKSNKQRYKMNRLNE
jgi:hypothetical protein